MKDGSFVQLKTRSRGKELISVNIEAKSDFIYCYISDSNDIKNGIIKPYCVIPRRLSGFTDVELFKKKRNGVSASTSGSLFRRQLSN